MLRDQLVPLYDKNPTVTRQKNPDEIREKITIKDIPLSVSNDLIAEHMSEIGVILKTDVKYANERDNNGKLTDYKNGDRYMYAEGHIKNALNRNAYIAHRKCRIFHNGQFSVDCKACHQAGHKAGNPACPAMNTEIEMTCFATHHVVLSNTYHNKISAYGQTFKSVQHAWLWKRAYDNKQLDLAQRIKDAEHAGLATRLSHEIKDNKDIDNDTSSMKHILTLRAKQCTEYQAALSNSATVMAAAITDKFWGTGLSAQATTRTKPEYWPGNNMLGKIMADIRDELITRQHTQDNLEQMEGSPAKDGETDVGTTPDGDAARGEAQVDAETTPGETVATSSNITDTPRQTTTQIPSKTTNAPECHGGEHDARSRTRTMRKSLIPAVNLHTHEIRHPCLTRGQNEDKTIHHCTKKRPNKLTLAQQQ